jgi:hypothetical protein
MRDKVAQQTMLTAAHQEHSLVWSECWLVIPAGPSQVQPALWPATGQQRSTPLPLQAMPSCLGWATDVWMLLPGPPVSR